MVFLYQSQKQNLLYYQKKFVPEGFYEIQFQNETIKSSDWVKYLGLRIDAKLTWNKHVEHIVLSASKALNILKILTGTWWGGHPQVLLNIYKGLIRSKIEYGIYLWLRDTNIFQKLTKIQNSALRICIGCRVSTPIRVLHAEACIPYLKEREQYLADRFIICLLSQENHPLHTNLSELYLQIENTPIMKKILDQFPILRFYAHLINQEKSKTKEFKVPIE